jgi:hypothetical protein
VSARNAATSCSATSPETTASAETRTAQPGREANGSTCPTPGGVCSCPVSGLLHCQGLLSTSFPFMTAATMPRPGVREIVWVPPYASPVSYLASLSAWMPATALPVVLLLHGYTVAAFPLRPKR